MEASRSPFLVCRILPLAACGDSGPPKHLSLPVGRVAETAETRHRLVSHVNIAPGGGLDGRQDARGRRGLAVNAFATGLDHPRWLYVLPNGDVLVAETNAPEPSARAAKVVRGWVMGLVMKRAGAGVPSADRITLLRDADGDGVAETRTVFAWKACTRRSAWPWSARPLRRQRRRDRELRLQGRPDRDCRRAKKVADLPGGPLNHHWTKNIIASRDGTKLYVDRRLQQQHRRERHGQGREPRRDPRSRSRNRQRRASSPPACAIPTAWAGNRDRRAVDRGQRARRNRQRPRARLHDIGARTAAFYGWPYSYYGQHVDTRVEPPATRPGRQGHCRPTMRSALTPPRSA